MLTASLHQAMRSTGCASPCESRWSAVIGAFRSSLFRCEVVSREVRFEVVPLAVRWCTGLLLCFLIVGIHAPGISIPLSLLMLSGWSLMWIASLTLRLYQCESRSISFRNGGGLGTGESYIPVMLFDPLLHRSSCFANVDFSAFTGNPVDCAVLFSRIDGVLWSH